MKRTHTRPGTASAWILGLILGLASPLALATDVEALELFELDGDAMQDDGTPPPYDWETLAAGTPAGLVFTGIKSDSEDPQRIFSGGVKDIQDISSSGMTNKYWTWTTGSVPDKSNIKDAYAASMIYYNEEDENDPNNGDRIIYFGADRFSNVGDTFMGFWFFKNKVEIPEGSTGDFSGVHENGDALILVNFPQANNAVPLIQVVAWDSTCGGKGEKVIQNNYTDGDCVANNLRLVTGEEGAGAICDVPPVSGGGNPNACAITNETTVDSPWPYTSKDGFVDEFPFETFFEGGINLTQLFPNSDGCFASFMAETRSSSSFTADLKDFVLADFPVCSTDIATEIHSNTADDTDHTNDYQTPSDGVPAGSGVHDLARLTFGAPDGVNVLGTVTFTTYANACSELLDENGDPVSELPESLDTYTVNVDFATNGNDLEVESNGWANDNVNSGKSRDDTDFPGAGTFSYLVQFTSTTDGIPDSDYHCEQLTVNTLTPTMFTRIHSGLVTDADHNVDQNLDGNTVLVGTTIHDYARVSGVSNPALSGSVTFAFYKDDNCSADEGDPSAFDSDTVTLSVSGATGTAETKGVSTAGFITASNAHQWVSIKATYSGDSNYKTAVATCEVVKVVKRTPGIETHVILLDQARVSGDGYTTNPSGTVDFVIYNNGTCSGTGEPDILRTVTGVPLAAVDSELIARLTTTDEVVVKALGTTTNISYKATYNGDNNYSSVTHACEKVAVTLPAAP
ncbi:hypothetical protein [Oceanimonas smirnovii]|uniref:hypothetical protein n=1 Tax=Oceanimonas smirnovii TaxID=264574 RepID=UPI00037711E5|nr:hypothetical protein [Oceanimonas smirnovii]